MQQQIHETQQGLPHISEVKPKDEGDDALFAELAQVLDKYGAIDRFGVYLLHRHHPVYADETTLEETDEETRVQTLRPMKTAEIGEGVIETSWRLDASGKALSNCVCTGPDAWNHHHQSIGG